MIYLFLRLPAGSFNQISTVKIQLGLSCTLVSHWLNHVFNYML